MAGSRHAIDGQLLVEALQRDPNITQKELANLFGCGATTISRRLKDLGLSTRPWSERKHRPEAKLKLSEAGSRRVGEKNPNFGEKRRPWLEGSRHPLRQWHRANPDFGSKQRGAANPVHACRHLYEDPSYVARIVRGLLQHAAEKNGRSYEEVYGSHKAEVIREKLREASPRRLAKFTRRVTRPEKIVAGLLDGLGVAYETQVAFGPHTVDFFVADHNLVIQADGDYWHANPLIYLAPSTRQLVRRKIDASCNSYLRSRGISLLRFWESDLYGAPDQCRAAVIQQMEM